MSAGRAIAAAIVGGIVMFGWGAASHMILPIGDMGLKSLPNEEGLVTTLKSNVTERGFYLFPGMGHGEVTEEEMKAWEEKYQQGPRGVLVFDPTGDAAMSPAMLGTEFVSNFLACLIAACILARIATGRFERGLIAGGFGVLGWLSIEVSFWNWYRFPTQFAVGELIDQSAGWLLAGWAIALVLPRARVEAPATGTAPAKA